MYFGFGSNRFLKRNVNIDWVFVDVEEMLFIFF